MPPGPRPVIGMISPFWLPTWGGAEQYHFRFVKALQARGLDVRVLCATAEVPGRENGDLAVSRFAPRGDLGWDTWAEFSRKARPAACEAMARHFAFIDHAVSWCRENGVEVALIGSPYQRTEFYQARELYRRLKDSGIRVGLVHHDLPPRIAGNLATAYRSGAGGWDAAADTVLQRLRQLARGRSRPEWTMLVESPLFFEPDFVISNSHWSHRFIDPLGECPSLVVHPLIQPGFAMQEADGGTELKRADVLMVNPQGLKNPHIMKEVIRLSDSRNSFRVLKGGWGNAFSTFLPEVRDLAACREGRAEFIDYVRDIRKAYRAARLLLFPSFTEGYGMVAVEAMSCGTPVLCSNHPAILEAVGDAGMTLCPYRDGGGTWAAAVDEMLRHRDHWSGRARARAAALAERQDAEVTAAAAFLAGQSGRGPAASRVPQQI